MIFYLHNHTLVEMWGPIIVYDYGRKAGGMGGRQGRFKAEVALNVSGLGLPPCGGYVTVPLK